MPFTPRHLDESAHQLSCVRLQHHRHRFHMGVESCNALPTSFSTRLLLYRRSHFGCGAGCGGETAIASSELRVVKLLTGLFTPSLLPLESIDSTV